MQVASTPMTTTVSMLLEMAGRKGILRRDWLHSITNCNPAKNVPQVASKIVSDNLPSYLGIYKAKKH